MGLCSSDVFHEDEKGIDDMSMPYLNYAEQPDEEYKQLDTENDQKGDTAVEHIFKKTKTVYGQPPKDMRGTAIDWKVDYEIDLKKRPCPYDFPAFQFDKPPDYDEKKREAEKHEKGKVAGDEKSTSQQRKQQGKGGKGVVKKKKSRRSKSTPSKDAKDAKRSLNADLDECSLED